MEKKWIQWECFVIYPDLLCTSPYISSFILFLIRLLFSLFSTAINIWALAIKGKVFFEYFTQWNFTVLMIFFWIMTYFSLRKVLRKDETQRKINSAELAVGILAWAMYHMELVCALFIDIVVWGILFPWMTANDNKTGANNVQNDLITPISISCHAVNFVMMLIEFILNRLPFSRYFCLFSIMWGCLYAIFQWIYYYSPNGRWVYPFMNLQKGPAVVWYVGFIVLLVLFHLGAYYIFLKFKAVHCQPPADHLPIQFNQSSSGGSDKI